ncbi:phosphonopyruvate decarboxylase-like [Rhopilema esculentum]|uniref:phosphonopyruvate decarboxylase-like n=1 Tax=Rhopilema esculentum TaxID=499914 RepID=UPI0031D91A5E
MGSALKGGSLISELAKVLRKSGTTWNPAKRAFSTTCLCGKPSTDNVPGQTREGPEKIQNQQKRNEEAGSYTELVRDFLDPKEFFGAVRKHGIDYFCGVPDSLLKDFCAYVSMNVPDENHIITANEGTAIAVASGYHLASGKTAMVYLQNSGLGNIVNPLMSLAVPSVYSIPMLLFVGWRGEPGKRDEPQHVVQGKATPGLLAACGIPFQVLPDYLEGAEQALYTARKHMEVSKGPYCLLVRRQTFLPYKLAKDEPKFPLNREEAIKNIVDCLKDRDVVVGTTGMLSRELFEYREAKGQGHEKDFLCVGSMGHASAIALGIATQRPRRQVFCLDGDGAAIMHLGNLATIGNHSPPNLKHIVINNGAHDSVGGQPTDAARMEDFRITQIALGVGYKQAFTAVTPEEILDSVAAMREMEGPVLLEIKVNKGNRKNLGRPTRTPIQNKADFMHFLAID